MDGSGRCLFRSITRLLRRGERRMKYTRIHTDEHGDSHLEGVDVGMLPLAVKHPGGASRNV
jgi:hypothetical protein